MEVGRKKLYRLKIQIHKIYEKPSLKTEEDSTHNSEASINTSDNILLDTNVLTCLICKKVFTEASEFYTHLKKHFSCDICRNEFTSKKFYQKHMRLHENKSIEYPFKCHTCKAIFESKEAIKKHSHSIPGKSNENGLKILFCKVCSMSFKNEANYRYFLFRRCRYPQRNYSASYSRVHFE